MAYKLKELARFKQEQKEADLWVMQQFVDKAQERFFNKHVPFILRLIMRRSKWLTKKLGYEIGMVDGDINKLILTKHRKLVAKTF
jgi:hypothetical protein